MKSRRHWGEQLKASLPTRDSLAEHAWLKPIAHRVLDAQLWRLHHESVARGAAIGMVWAFFIPAAQMVVAAFHCVWWRGNIPVAVGVTMITNPFTIGFWLWLAYKVGNLVLDMPLPVPLGEGAGWLEWIGAFGWPTVLGMGLFGSVGAVVAYALVKLVWLLQVRLRRRFRLKSRAAAKSRL